MQISCVFDVEFHTVLNLTLCELSFSTGRHYIAYELSIPKVVKPQITITTRLHINGYNIFFKNSETEVYIKSELMFTLRPITVQ